MRWQKLLKYLGLASSITLLTLLFGLGIFPTTARLTATEIAVSSTPTTPSLSSHPLELVQQGKEYYQSGEFTQAVTLWQQAATAFAEQGDRLNQAMVLSNLALAYQQLGNWPEANQAIATSLKLLQSNFPGNPTDRLKILAQALNTQGSLQLAQGQTREAITSWQKAANTYQQIGDEPGHIQSTINQAQALKTAGLFPRACKILLPSELQNQDCRTLTPETLERLKKTLQNQPDTLIQAARLLNLGNTLRLVGKPEASQEVLQLSLNMAQRLQSLPDESAALLSLGNTHQVLAQKACDASAASDNPEQKIQQAQDFYQKAFNNYEQAATTAISPTAKTQAQLNRLSLLVNIQELSDDDNIIEECISQVRQDTVNQDLKLAQIQNQLNRLPLNRTAIYARINFAQNIMALRQQENTFSASSLPTPSDIAQILATAVQQAQELGDIQAQSYALGYLGQLYEQTQQWTQAIDLTQQALSVAQISSTPNTIAYRWEWQLGRIYKAQVENQAIAPTETSDLKQAIAYYNSAFNRLQIVRQNLAASTPDLQLSFRDKTEEPLYFQFIDLLLRPEKPSQDNLKQARKVIESLQIFALENFLEEPCNTAKPELLDQVVENHAPTTAVLYPIILPDRLEVIFKLAGQGLQKYSSKVEQAEIEALLEELEEDLRVEYTFEAVKQRSQQLYQWLLAPIENRLEAENIDTLVFVLHGSLQKMPMAALHDGKNYLIEKYAVAASLGLTIPEPQPLPKDTLKVLAASLSIPPENFPQFTELTFVNEELDQIQEAGASPTFLRNQNFTTQAFNKQFNQSAFPIIHLATHGQFSSNPEQTFILTANGKININQLGKLFRTRRLNRSDAIELLILSACETASGDKKAPLGIAGTTIRAGANSVLATLWTVYDEASVGFTKEFYTQLLQPGVTKAEALRQAQLALKKIDKYQHPRYWAPYILTGNWL